MNPLPGNPHYEAAVTNRYAGDMRFTEATLAVAWEQRTANLQRERDALAAISPDEQGDGWTDAYDKLTSLIDRRLGL